MSSLPGLPQIRTVNEVVVGSSGNVDPCGVQDLPPEIMYNIFLQNTEHDHHSHNRLNTARYCSQVCQSWRSLLLSSPTIWGRLLTDEYFRNTTRGRVWAREVLSRAGDALLWVEGRLSASPADFVVEWVLKEKWENVQFASLEFFSMDPEDKWFFLGKESPNLESLSVVVFHRLRPLAVPALFSNVAPRLQVVRLPGCFKFPNAPLCLSNLRILTLDTDVPTIISMLRLMPLLTHLRIQNGLSRMPGDPQRVTTFQNMAFTPVDLPQLESLQIFSRYYEEVLALLECIMPSPQCSLFTSCLGKITRYDSEGDEVWISPSKAYDAIIRWMLAMPKSTPGSLSGCGPWTTLKVVVIWTYVILKSTPYLRVLIREACQWA